MRTWIYKRHHKGDPDAAGQFGICDCMGQHRKRRFEAVVGVGGKSAKHGLAGKVNWIGIGAQKTPLVGKRGPIITFDHFLLFESNGPSFRELAPKLAERMYSEDRCDPMVDSLDPEWGEVEKILALAKDAPPSSADGARRVTSLTRCVPRTARREHPAEEKKICSSGRVHTTSSVLDAESEASASKITRRDDD